MAIRITFDSRPGNGGPSRYVASLVHELTSPEWVVQFMDRDESSQRIQTVTRSANSIRGSAVVSRSSRRLTHAVPRFAKMWLGFRRDAGRRSRVIRETPTDLFHTQKTGCEEMPVAARMAKIPYILGTFHVNSACDLYGERSGLTHRAMEWYSNRCLDLAIAVSEATKQDWVRRTGISAERVITIHNGIDPAQFFRQQSKTAARGHLGLPQNAVILGGLGRLAPAKGFEYLIEAVAALRSDFPNVCVAIAGNGGLRESLETQAQTLGVSDRVIFLGFQSDVNLVLDACDIFVLSSLSEALPFALLEAMAHELPTVGTTVGGVPEVIVAGETGFLCPPRDGIALAKALWPLIESADLRERLGRAGRARVIKHFHEADMVRKTLDVYRRMLATRPNRRGGNS